MTPKLSLEKRFKLISRALGGESISKICREAHISRILFYRWLKRYRDLGEKGLAPGEFGRPRKSHTPVHPKPYTILSPSAKQKMINEVLIQGSRPTEVAKKYEISRVTLYKWLKRYKQAPQEAKEEAIVEKERKIERFWRQAPEKYEEAVLSLIAKHPEYGVRRLVANLPKIGKTPILGHHGVQNVLRRHNLSLSAQRFVYAQAQITPFTRTIADILAYFTGFFAIPAETRSRIVRFVGVASLSAFVTVVTLGLAGFIARGFVSVSGVELLGMFFASAALFMGSVFFLYSIKYYLTLAIVLSFSQQEVTSDKRQITSKKRNDFLSWILGLANGETSLPRGKQRRGVGLEPDLEHVKLKRYPTISVHIPFYNEKNVVERAIHAATNFDYQGEYEVILADDSTDETTKIIKDYLRVQSTKCKVQRGEGYTLTTAKIRPGVTVKHLHRTSRSGFKGGALRLALRVTDPKAEFVTVFDADFVPYPDTLTLFLKYFKVQNDMSEDYKKTNVAAVQGYQWHVLNKSENWITRGVRSEYAGSYVIERSGIEIYSGLKQISGAVYMIRRDVLEEVGWGTSITEDFELTLRLYAQGYKVVYTPYIQAPAECVSTIKRVVRQRMRWAEGHSNNVKRMFKKLLLSPNLERAEKLEFLYLSPYYLQAFFFLIGTLSWLISETLFPSRLPFWTSLWGWSLVLTNMLALPLMNAVGLFLEESEERDYLGLASFVALSYILVPFQAYAAVKGFLEKEEGPWFRTPKTGRITDIFTRGRFYRLIAGILPGRVAPAMRMASSPYLELATANSRFSSFSMKPKRMRWVGKAVLISVLIISLSLTSLTPFIQSGIDSLGSAGLKIPELVGKKIDFRFDEEPEFILDTKAEKPVGGRLFSTSVAQAAETPKVESEVSYRGKKLDVPIETSKLSDGKLALKVGKTNELKPGRYEFRTVVVLGEQRLVNTQDFTWGVLAINVDKSIYLPAEKAYLQMAVLDDSGQTVCDASVKLEIQNPESEAQNFSTEDGTIKKSQDCGPTSVTYTPDYFAHYEVGGAGVYKLKLTANTANGERSIEDAFEVKEAVLMDIARRGPTRIYPPEPYEMRFSVKAKQDFAGEIKEKVPESFAIASQDGLSISGEGKEKILTWHVDWKEGGIYELEYHFDAPNQSPQFYSLGPLRLIDKTGNTLFEETRQWQIAADANADFAIQRRCETPAAGTGTVTLTAGTDYTAPASNTNAFIRMISTRLSGMGDRSLGGTQDADDFTWYISDPDFAGGSVAFTRAGTTNEQRFCWEIIEYVGSSGGPNEMIVRGVGTATYTTTGLTVDGGSVTVTNDADVAVFIIGQNSVEVATQAQVAAGQSTSEWVAASDIPRFTRGIDSSDANSISYAVVEFTGSNWAVERIQHQFTLAGTTETETITDVGALDRAFLHAQYRRGDAGGLDEAGAEMWLSATNQASFFLQSTAGVPSNKYGVIWIVRNSDTVSSTKMNVQHLSGSRTSAGVSEGAANEEDEWTDTITAVGDTAQTSIMGESVTSAGTGNAYPRGWISLYLNTTTGVKLYQSDDGQPQTYRFQVVEWPNSVAINQIHYRWRNDDGSEAAATWAKAEDTSFTGATDGDKFPRNTTYRLRFEVSNEGTQSSGGVTYQLQVAETSTCSSGSYSAVPTDTSGHWSITNTANLTDGAATTNVASGLTDEATTFVAGETKDTGNTTASITLTSDRFTEIEFAVQATSNSTSLGNYCFRLFDTTGSSALDAYSKYGEAVVVPEFSLIWIGLAPLIPLLLKRRKSV